MVKNWITQGDAAFDADEKPVGCIRFRLEEMADWPTVAMERIKSAKTERITQYAKATGHVVINGLFSKKQAVKQEIFNSFCQQAAKLFGVQLFACDMMTSTRADDNEVIISFVDI